MGGFNLRGFAAGFKAGSDFAESMLDRWDTEEQRSIKEQQRLEAEGLGDPASREEKRRLDEERRRLGDDYTRTPDASGGARADARAGVRRVASIDPDTGRPLGGGYLQPIAYTGDEVEPRSAVSAQGAGNADLAKLEPAMVAALGKAGGIFGSPFEVTYGTEGGHATNSWHYRQGQGGGGLAADIRDRNYSPEQRQQAIMALRQSGFTVLPERDHIHVEWRGNAPKAPTFPAPAPNQLPAGQRDQFAPTPGTMADAMGMGQGAIDDEEPTQYAAVGGNVGYVPRRVGTTASGEAYTPRRPQQGALTAVKSYAPTTAPAGSSAWGSFDPEQFGTDPGTSYVAQLGKYTGPSMPASAPSYTSAGYAGGAQERFRNSRIGQYNTAVDARTSYDQQLLAAQQKDAARAEYLRRHGAPQQGYGNEFPGVRNINGLMVPGGPMPGTPGYNEWYYEMSRGFEGHEEGGMVGGSIAPRSKLYRRGGSVRDAEEEPTALYGEGGEVSGFARGLKRGMGGGKSKSRRAIDDEEEAEGYAPDDEAAETQLYAAGGAVDDEEEARRLRMDTAGPDVPAPEEPSALGPAEPEPQAAPESNVARRGRKAREGRGLDRDLELATSEAEAVQQLNKNAEAYRRWRGEENLRQGLERKAGDIRDQASRAAAATPEDPGSLGPPSAIPEPPDTPDPNTVVGQVVQRAMSGGPKAEARTSTAPQTGAVGTAASPEGGPRPRETAEPVPGAPTAAPSTPPAEPTVRPPTAIPEGTEELGMPTPETPREPLRVKLRDIAPPLPPRRPTDLGKPTEARPQQKPAPKPSPSPTTTAAPTTTPTSSQEPYPSSDRFNIPDLIKASGLPNGSPRQFPLDPKRNQSVAQATMRGITSLLTGNGAVQDPNQIRQNAAAIARGQGAATPQEMKVVINTSDPESKLTAGEALRKSMHDTLNFWVARNNIPEAMKQLTAIGLFARQQATTAGNLALQALDAGKPESAAKLIARAYSYIPNGKQLLWGTNADGNIEYQFAENGKLSDKQVASPEQLKAFAMEMANGKLWDQEMIVTAAGRGTTRAARPAAAPREPRPSVSERKEARDNEAKQKELADKDAQIAAEKDPARKQQLQAERAALPADQRYERNRRTNKINGVKISDEIDNDEAVTQQKWDEPRKSLAKRIANDLMVGNKQMDETMAANTAAFALNPSNNIELRGDQFVILDPATGKTLLQPFNAKYDIMQRIKQARDQYKAAQPTR